MTDQKLQISIIVSYLAAGISVVVSMLYTPFMLRMLGQSEYGIYQLVCSVASYLSLLSFGFGSSYIRFFSRYNGNNEKEKISSLNGMFLTVYGILAFICVIVGMCLIGNLDAVFKNLTDDEIETAKILLFFLSVNVAITFVNSVFDSFIIAHEKFVFQKLVYVLKTVLNPILTVPFLLLGFKSVTLTVVTTLLTCANLVVNYIYCKNRLEMKLDLANFDFRLLKEIVVFSSFIFLNILTDQINWNLDKFLLGIYRSSTEIAIYGVASQLNSYYMSCSTIISSVFIPKVNRIVANGNNIKLLDELFIKIGRIQFMILGLISSGFVFFGQRFINIWAGKGYETSYIPTVILLFSAMVPLIQNIGIEIQKAENLHKFRSVIYTLIAAGNFVFSMILTPHYGVIGCTVGTSLSLIIGNVIIMNVYYAVKIHLDVKLFWKNILKIVVSMIIPVIYGTVCMNFINLQSLTAYVGAIVLYTLIYCLSLYTIGMNNNEKRFVTEVVKKVFKGARAAEK